MDFTLAWLPHFTCSKTTRLYHLDLVVYWCFRRSFDSPSHLWTIALFYTTQCTFHSCQLCMYSVLIFLHDSVFLIIHLFLRTGCIRCPLLRCHRSTISPTACSYGWTLHQRSHRRLYNQTFRSPSYRATSRSTPLASRFPFFRHRHRLDANDLDDTSTRRCDRSYRCRRPGDLCHGMVLSPRRIAFVDDRVSLGIDCE